MDLNIYDWFVLLFCFVQLEEYFSVTVAAVLLPAKVEGLTVCFCSTCAQICLLKSYTWQHKWQQASQKPSPGQRQLHRPKSSRSLFSLHADVSPSFICGPQRQTRFHDVAALLNLMCFCCSLCLSVRNCGGSGLWLWARLRNLVESWAGTSVEQSSFRS